MTSTGHNLVDRDGLVLVVVDIQERLAAAMERRAQVAGNAAKLARLAAIVGAPIIVTRQYPKGLGETVPEVEQPLADLEADGAAVRRVDKTTFCCAGEPAFMEALRATGRTQPVLVGMETHICVTQSALALLEMGGYAPQVVADACCSRETEAHETALDRLRAAGVVVTTTESVMYEAVGAAGTDEFKKLLAVVKGEA